MIWDKLVQANLCDPPSIIAHNNKRSGGRVFYFVSVYSMLLLEYRECLFAEFVGMDTPIPHNFDRERVKVLISSNGC